MYCINTKKTIEITLKKSRFIGIVLPCDSENAVVIALKNLHKKHPNANHIAFAYRIKSPKGLICRFNDAGEPTGTAGKPIYQHLEGKNLINSLITVVRYFGGIKLGAGGLSRAYGNSAANVIAASKINLYIEYTLVKLSLEYKQMQRLNYQLKKLEGEIIEQTFAENVILWIKIPEKNLETLQALFRY
ncbi:MAG: YigZ family protein [Methylococcales bacterium]|nr:YigZ family protein [Methylococcales bacterium]